MTLSQVEFIIYVIRVPAYGFIKLSVIYFYRRNFVKGDPRLCHCGYLDHCPLLPGDYQARFLCPQQLGTLDQSEVRHQRRYS